MKTARLAAALVALLCSAACEGREPPSPVRDAPQEVIDALKTPDDPYRIIYHPPVDLARRPAR
ncbi:MAG TPA: hypothetical protein VGA20_05245 [Gemmatimonadales bacterium]